MAGKLVQCATCAVWHDFATGYYKKDKQHFKNTGSMTCGTCRRLQCKNKLLSGIPPPAMTAGATPVAMENAPYESSPPEYYSVAAGPQRTQTQNTPSPFLGHHPDPTNDYYYHHQQQQQYLPAAPVYYHYYDPAHSHRHNDQVPTTTTQYSSHRNPDGRKEEEGGGGWNAATTQLQQQQSHNNFTRTE